MAAENGDIFELEGYGAAGMSAHTPDVLTKEKTIAMPHGSELMMLPQRKPLVYNIAGAKFEVIENNPFVPKEKIFPVAVFNSPGYVNKHSCAYDDNGLKNFLPLFSYGATGFGKNNFRSSAILVDREPRQDLRQMLQKDIIKGINRIQKKYPVNRLMRHLETCALEYGCPAGKNFFLQRYEAPLPTSTICNANCLGCISLQTKDNLCACQDRIAFMPKTQEIAQVCLEHISHVKNCVVSFGQGCEGEPLTAFKVIEPAINYIRQQTDKGTINLNTNAGIPQYVEKLCKTGLDSMRVSLNSVRKNCYNAYFRPRSYHFSDVLKSIETAKFHGKFVAINYLNCPGFTDSKNEFKALRQFIDQYKIDMIQWRNLNFDPKKYCEIMSKVEDSGKPLGMETIIEQLKNLCPELMHGYFNPPKIKFHNNL